MSRGPAEMPFLDHLEELRWRLIWSLGIVAVASVLGFFVVTELDLIGVLALPIRDLLPDERLLFTNPTTPVVVTFKLAFITGVVLSLPFLAYHLWAFLSPALHDHERRYVVPAIWVGFLLFLAGIAMAYFLVLPLALRFLLGFQAQALDPIITIDEYLRFATRLILIFGVIFEMPVIFVLLALIGIVTPEMLRTYRRHAILVAAIVAAILTPADVGTMMMMLVPVALLYEVSIWLTVLVVRRRGSRGRVAPEESGA